MPILVLQNGEVLPLAALTYGSLGVGLAGLALVVLALGTLRRLRSNRHSIRRHGAAALLLAQLVFLLGINQADVPVCGKRGLGREGRSGDHWEGLVRGSAALELSGLVGLKWVGLRSGQGRGGLGLRGGI